MKIELEKQNQHFLVILLFCLGAFFANNNFLPADLMESRNLATAQEMIHTGNYMVPTMNGNYRMEKPPLPTWVATCIESCQPNNLSAQRVATGVVATLMVFFVYLLCLEITGNRQIGFISSIVLATSYNVMMMARNATWDIYCHSFMVIGIYFFVCSMKRQGNQWWRFILAGLFWGLSFMSKGPVSFYTILLPFLISYIFIYRPKIKGKTLPVVSMIMVCLIVSFWWYAYIYAFHKDAILYALSKESGAWVEHNVRPWFYYWKFPAEAGIWALFWITSLIWAFRQKKYFLGKRYLFFLLWTITSLVLLSLMPEKKSRYLLPLLIPGALNIGSYIYYCIKGRLSLREELVFRINAGLIYLILIAAPAGLYFTFCKKGYLGIGLFAFISVCSLLLAWAIYRTALRRKKLKVLPAFYSIAGVMLLVSVLCFIPAGKMFINEDRHSIAEIRNDQRLKQYPFYYVNGEEMRMELVYESDKIIRPLTINDPRKIKPAVPFVLLSEKPAGSIFRGCNYKIEQIGVYDNNWRKKDSKRYNKSLVRYVSLIRM